MIALDRNRAPRDKLLRKKTTIQDRVATALMDEESYERIVGRANTASAIIQRIKLLDEIFVQSIA
jgi:hypothetical protein